MVLMVSGRGRVVWVQFPAEPVKYSFLFLGYEGVGLSSGQELTQRSEPQLRVTGSIIKFGTIIYDNMN